jgi:hypothetical protein
MAIMIGIIPTDQIDQTKNSIFREVGYFIFVYGGLLYSKEYPQGELYCGKLEAKRNDTVGVEFDWDNACLSFLHQGKNLGIAFKDIPYTSSYSLCVILCDPRDQIELRV